MSDAQAEVRAYTLRLELVDEPGELLRSLRPIAEHGGNLLSIFHERGSVTPRGHIPVEVDVEATPDRFERIIDGLRDAEINVVQAGTERYSEAITVVLSGRVIDTDLSDTLSRIQESANATVTDLSLAAPEGTEGVSSARVHLAAEAGASTDVFERLRAVADEKGLDLITPLTVGSRT
ncbi:amino acid-binding protein [Halobellus sp. GM3]|uniref:amino acid-binding protein n=1 Tax=Halobellus sp. GM3 TaxID=3458410 RepID=UPI00403D8BC6